MIVACPSCGARFDVSAFRPGSKIRCGSCYAILRIPEQAGEELAAPARPAVRRGKPGAVPVRRKRRPAAKDPSAPAKRSPPPTAAPPKPESPPPKPAKPAPPKKPAVKRTDSLVGQTINNEFELVRKIGEGGYGTVYEGVDLTLKRRVAVKLMLREKTTNKEFVAKFLREARTAAQLNHPNIVKIHLVGFDRTLEQHFLAMEFVEGQTLSEIMKKDGVFPVERAVDVMIQAANGLGEAHKKNIIHRDIKPGNIMITPKGVVKVADFGLAKVYDPDDAASTIIGTPYFMPPEQFEGKVRDGRTDIYSLGVTLYYMLTLKRPFDGKTPAEVLLNIMKKDPPHPKELNPEVPDALWKIIQKMINRDLNERYATCEELLRDLRLYQESANTEERVFCASCGFANPFSAEECMECGNSLLEPCPVCGTPDFVDAKFCGNCGANLAKEREVAELVSEAESHVAAGRIEKAIETFRTAQEISEENSRVVAGLRQAEQTLAERDDAVKSVEVHLAEGRSLEALKAAEEAMDRFPGHEALGELLARARQEAQGQRVREAVEQAEAHLAAGALFDAVAAARRALEIDGESEAGRNVLAAAEGALAKYSAARDRAASLEEDGLLSEARAAWEETLEIVPGDEAAHQAVERISSLEEEVAHHRAQAEEALGNRDFAGARTHLANAVRVLPSDAGSLELLERLRAEESRWNDGLKEALEHLVAGRYEASRDALAELAREFPGEGLIRTAAQQVSAVLAASEGLIQAGSELLEAGKPELASAFARAAERLSPLDARAEEMLGRIKARKKEQMKALADIRELVGQGEHEKALEALESLGGLASDRAEVAELARQVHADLLKRRRTARDQKQEEFRSALESARSLLAEGRREAALAACQKALRIDRHSEEARRLKAEIDGAMEKVPEEPIDTGVFPLEGSGQS